MIEKFMEEATKAKNGKQMTKGILKIIVEDVHTNRNLPSDFSVSLVTIR